MVRRLLILLVEIFTFLVIIMINIKVFLLGYQVCPKKLVLRWQRRIGEQLFQADWLGWM